MQTQQRSLEGRGRRWRRARRCRRGTDALTPPVRLYDATDRDLRCKDYLAALASALPRTRRRVFAGNVFFA